MLKLSNWLHPGLKLKRWIFLLSASIVILAFGLSGNMGKAFRGFRLDVINPTSVERLAKQIQTLRFIDFVLLGAGIWGVIFALRRLAYSLVTVLTPHRGESLAGVVLQRARVMRGPKVVAIGGGTGLPHLLSGLKKFSSNLTAVVTVADDGGSSGRLRRDLEVLPPGDIRNCLVALARSEDLLSRLFQYRFQKGGDLVGHSFGNLLIAALSDITGDFVQAIKVSSDVLAIVGEVLPSTTDNVVLRATLQDGRRIEGETNISQHGGLIKELALFPKDPSPPPGVLERIHQAEIIMLGPGSLFTSVIPNLLVPDVAKAINEASAPVVYVANIMTQPGETDRFALKDHLEAIHRHTTLNRIDYVLFNSGKIASKKLKRYKATGSIPVELDATVAGQMGSRVVQEDLVSASDLIRHDSGKLALSVMKIIEMKMTRGVRTLRARRA